MSVTTVTVIMGLPEANDLSACGRKGCQRLIAATEAQPYFHGLEVSQGRETRRLFFCSEEHFEKVAEAAREGWTERLVGLQNIGRLFANRPRIVFVDYDREARRQEIKPRAELVPEEKAGAAELVEDRQRGAELVDDRPTAELVSDTPRPLWQRPAMIIGVVVLAFVFIVSIGILIAGRGPTEQSVEFPPTTPTIIQSKGTSTIPTVSAKETRPLVVSTRAPTSIVPSLVKISDCKGKAPAGVAVWFWTPNGMILPKDDKGNATIKFDGSETLNGMGLTKDGQTFCSAAKTGYTWAFYKK